MDGMLGDHGTSYILLGLSFSSAVNMGSKSIAKSLVLQMHFSAQQHGHTGTHISKVEL